MSEYDAKVLPDRARYVQPAMSEARLQRVWGEVSTRLPGQQRSRVWVWAAATLMCGAVAAGAFVLPTLEPAPDAQSLLAGAVLETASDSLSMALVDGSSLKLDQSSRVEVVKSSAQGVRLKLKRGRIQCDVKPREARNFVVVADGVEVRVVGTLFSVASERNAESRRVEVQVQRGVVEVRGSNQPGEVVRLEAGRSWSQVTKVGPAQISSSEPTPLPSAEPAASTPKPEPTEKVSGPRELLQEANQLRRAGKARQAAQRYELLLNKYGSDGRAGLAAFELGRLRMDRFGDMVGAVSALERAMALAPGSGFREDALARVVTAHARSGNQAACKQARQRYLKSYPQGVHRQAVLDQCSSR